MLPQYDLFETLQTDIHKLKQKIQTDTSQKSMLEADFSEQEKNLDRLKDLQRQLGDTGSKKEKSENEKAALLEEERTLEELMSALSRGKAQSNESCLPQRASGHHGTNAFGRRALPRMRLSPSSFPCPPLRIRAVRGRSEGGEEICR